MIVFSTGGLPVPLFARNARSYGGGHSVARREGDDAAHDLETADGQGPHGPVAQHDLSPHLPRHLSRPRAPRGPGGRAVGWIEAEVHAWLTARIAQRRQIAPAEWGSSHDPAQEGGPAMTPRHTTPAPVAHGGVRAVAHGRGRGDAHPVPTRKGGRHDPEHHR